MKNIFVVFFTFLALQSHAQASLTASGRSCSVVCLNQDWIPDSYDRGANCTIKQSANGIISVHETYDVSDREHYNKESFISFKVVLFKKDFDTMISYSDENYTELDVKSVLAKCEKGDEIIIILNNPDKYSLPHHRIKVI